MQRDIKLANVERANKFVTFFAQLYNLDAKILQRCYGISEKANFKV